MADRSKPRIVGGGGTALAALWSAYSTFTTAAQLPADASAGAKMLADPPIYLPWLLLAGFAVLLAWSLWPRPKGPDSEAVPVNQPIASGPSSIALGGIGDNAVIHIHPQQTAPSEGTLPPREPIVRHLSQIEIAAAMHRLGKRESKYDINAINQSLGAALRSVASRQNHVGLQCPKMPIWEAIRWVRGVINDDDHRGGFVETRRQIRQAAIEGRILIWGRRQVPPVTHDSLIEGRDVWTPIEPEYWQRNKIIPLANAESSDDAKHTAEEPVTGANDGHWSLRLDEGEVQRAWPIARFFDPSAPDELELPQPDTPLAEGIVFLELGRWGGFIDDLYDREPARRKVAYRRFERLAKNGDLTVWGSVKGVAPEKEIPKIAWGTFELDDGPMEENVARTRPREGETTKLFHTDLMTSRAQLTRVRMGNG